MRNGTIAFSALRALRALRMVAALGGVFGAACAVAAGLNDTGVTTCADASGATVSCTAATAVQGQDARYGRDAAAGTGALTKVGGGANGFDFTKISNAGAVLPSTAPLGTGAGEWGCTYDNTTGLMWEVKTTSGLRNTTNSYSWYSSNATINGGGVGFSSGGSCGITGRCDTEKFTQDVNAAGMCGHNDWRMPTLRELIGLTRFEIHGNFLLDGSYFPNPDGLYTWSGSPDTNNPNNAWFVGLYYGIFRSGSRINTNSIHLVRVGQ